MSLSTIIAKPEVRDKFKQALKKPKLPKSAELVAPPLSPRYGLVGTAFDYLFRFMMKRALPSAIDTTWIAEQWLDRPMSDEEMKSMNAIADKANTIVRIARERYSEYLSNGRLSQSIIASAIGLAQLDQVFRIQVIDPELGVVHPEDIQDLEALASLVDINAFLGKHLILLNPTFGKASALVRGADADAFVDGTLYELKVTKNLGLPPDMFNQVMGYVVLNEIDGIGEIKPKPRIKAAAVYYARHAYLFKFNVEDVIDEAGLKELSQWLTEFAERTYPRLRK